MTAYNSVKPTKEEVKITQSHCSKCNTMGTVFNKRFNTVYVECPKCTHKWKTQSETCPICGKANGFAVEGICGTCYSTGEWTKR